MASWCQSSSYTSGTVLVTMIIMMTLGTHAIPNSPPRIIKQPPPDELLFKVAQQSKESDKPFIIECEADGNPPPTYEWIKNGKPFEYQVYDNRISQQPARGSLVISAPRDEDMGQYQCFAKNEFGIATSNSVFVRKAELNSFKDDSDKTIIASPGKPFHLKCEPPDGWPKPTVNWLIQGQDGGIKTINNSRMTVDPEGSLWFSNVTIEDESTNFFYACSATSLFRSEYKIGNRVKLVLDRESTPSSFNKHELVEQYVSRKNTIAMRGKTAELYCIYGGTPLPQTVWKKNSRPIEWSDRITQGHYGKSLIIKHVSFDDNGTYTCDVSNGVGTAKSYSMHLTVQSVPYFTREPEILNAAEEEDAEFVCEAEGVPTPRIYWIHNGRLIDERANPRRIVEPNRIFIRNLVKSDTGNYGCNATNEHGYVYKDVYLNVLSLAPEILQPPQKMRTVENANVELVCKVFGAPKPYVKWLLGNQTLSGGKFKTAKNGSLIIHGVSHQESGIYTCIAENKHGKVSETGSLEVKKATKIDTGPTDYEVVAGQTATFRCNAVADPSLRLEIDWLKDGVGIDFEREARFLKTNDNSLVITQTIELDSGVYTCKAKTDLDEVSAPATLIVQDVPNPPQLLDVECDRLRAKISWQPTGDKRSPILRYLIQLNTSFTPDTWETLENEVPNTDFTYTVPLSPWANYTFRVIAVNKIGPSLPSKHSERVCTTDPDVPGKNPENVEGKGTEPNNMVITWTPMPKIEHNGERFMYRVFWKRENVSDEQWQHRDIDKWEVNHLMINDTPIFQPYLIKVVAINEKGMSNVAPKEIIGYSGEAEPLEAPTNFTLINVVSSTSAVLSWNPVDPKTVRGHFKGYKIQTWTQEEGEENYREIHVKGDSNKALVTKFKPNSKNYARVLVYNGRYNGPPSAVIDFDTPEGTPSPVQSFDAFPLGSSALLLQWKKPLHPNGKLTGYKISYQEVIGTKLDEHREEQLIPIPTATRKKLAGLKENTKYRLTISATTKAGPGEQHFIERSTGSSIVQPDIPDFEIQQIPSDNGRAKIRVIWKPNMESNKPGSIFKVKYRKKGIEKFIEKEEKDEDFIDIGDLDPDSEYEITVVSIDGHNVAEAPLRTYDTSVIEGPIKVPNENVANAGWFIGMMLALAIIILLFIIVCIIRRNRGGKYDVHDRELANGRRDYPDEGGFHEYSQPLDTKSAGRQSVSSNQLKPESDTDSMAEYGDGDTGQFTEDGSFIGQYVPGKLQPPVSPQPVHNQQQPPLSQGTNNAVATYV